MPRSLSLGPGPHKARHCAIVKLKLSQTQFFYHFVKIGSVSECFQDHTQQADFILGWRDVLKKNKSVKENSYIYC